MPNNKPNTSWKVEYREKFLAFEDPDILDGFAYDELMRWIAQNFIYKPDLREALKDEESNTPSFTPLPEDIRNQLKAQLRKQLLGE